MGAEGFFSNLDVLYGDLGIGKLYLVVLIPKKFNFFSVVIFFNGSVFSLKCWIRIRMK
jgi:hypothetical protein